MELTGESIPVDEMRKAAKFRLGKLANWQEVEASIKKSEVVLKRSGYLGVTSTPILTLEESNHIVNLEIKVDKGAKSTFGTLKINGLSEPDERRVFKLWKLQEGVALDGPYFDEYLKELFEIFKKLPGTQFRTRPNGNVIDIVLTFK